MASRYHPPEKNRQAGPTGGNRITTALMLAAGTGSRLRPHTEKIPKCLVEVGGKPLLAHVLEALEVRGFRRFVIITGYRHKLIDEFLEQYDTPLDVETVFNDQYDSTNNIYTLWFAGKFVDEPFLLLESDLIFEPDVLAELCRPDRIALDRYNPELHSGTTATVTACGHLASLFINDPAPPDAFTYKTVNIYSFSRETWRAVHPALEKKLAAGNVDSFYEAAIRDLVDEGAIRLKMADFSDSWWDEIDSEVDLDRANRNFTSISAANNLSALVNGKLRTNMNGKLQTSMNGKPQCNMNRKSQSSMNAMPQKSMNGTAHNSLNGKP
ncbi:MAG: phosphocholine cytidylyltransferase family protein [Balneolaceae bacterium]|nr:MAG: phosphocholine cytidylyltransferase family protein [Balneolaceae bacterium]